MREQKDLTSRWVSIARTQLLNRKIVAVRYMTDEEAEEIGWYSRPVIIQLDDGNQIFPAADDEGNDAGALFTSSEADPVLPVLSRGD